MKLRLLTAVLVAMALPSAAAGHDLDHGPSGLSPTTPIGTTVNSGGPGAKWELLNTFATGNPHTDLDFFTKNGEMYASVGTLAASANAGGQTIVRLTQGGAVSPTFVAGHPSASCVSDAAAALGLQHDVEAAPKGDVLFNEANPFGDRRDAQLLLDATDNEGRCHDSTTGGINPADPQGGLEIIDITNVADPVEIGLTSHIGEAHTVNVDPKRPHIAYAVTSDAVTVTGGVRQNGIAASADRLDLDGFEVLDLSSCMNFAPGADVVAKRLACQPEVYRYRFPSAAMALGHTVKNAVYGCHELEVYANDLLTCGAGAAAIVLNMRGAFNDMGTPSDFTDDKPRGAPLPCNVRPSVSILPTYLTGAMVTDCVVGEGGQSLDVPSWLAMPSRPELEGVQYLGSIHHQGRGGPYPSPEDNDFNHETELTASGKFLIATDERGGGVTPPGATCTPGVDFDQGNGGLHAYRVDRLTTTGPGTPEEAWSAYARTPTGAKAIHRTPIRTQPEGSLCTAHVFQQIPGQNRIFMGWYSQGTRVVDFVEHADGSFEFREAGWFIPEHANTWTSHVFRVDTNPDCTFTYWGATGDFSLGVGGRSAIDIYKVTLPAPPNHVCAQPTNPPPGPPPPPASRPPAKSPCTIVGTARNDTLVGTNRADVICGRAGNDLIQGLRGNDRIYGGAGNDRVFAGSGHDRVYGGAGHDRLLGGYGHDLLAGEKGNDGLWGEGGDDRLLGRAGRDQLRGGFGADRLGGGSGNDDLVAGPGKNSLSGNLGNDKLDARNGARDRVIGGAGRDVALLDRFDIVTFVERLLRR